MSGVVDAVVVSVIVVVVVTTSDNVEKSRSGPRHDSNEIFW